LHQFPNANADAASIDHKARSAEADAFISAVPANVTYSAATSTPGYIQALDVVIMPLFEQYKSADAFYSTAIHELAHWTGPRLKRDLTGRFGDRKHALEELVAELTACFTLPQFGMNNEQNNARYLAAWISALKEKPQILTSVASEAAKVNAFLNAFSEAQRKLQRKLQRKSLPRVNTRAVSSRNETHSRTATGALVSLSEAT
jgi:putative DNA primase/helicase